MIDPHLSQPALKNSARKLGPVIRYNNCWEAASDKYVGELSYNDFGSSCPDGYLVARSMLVSINLCPPTVVGKGPTK